MHLYFFPFWIFKFLLDVHKEEEPVEYSYPFACIFKYLLTRINIYFLQEECSVDLYASLNRRVLKPFQRLHRKCHGKPLNLHPYLT